MSRAHEAVLLEQLTAQPDASLTELGKRWATATGEQVSVMTVWRTVKRLGWTRKKTRQASERRAEARLAWWVTSLGLDPDKLVFVDESGCQLHMSRFYARAPKGRRAYSSTPHHPGERVNLIAALSTSGIQAPWLVTGGSVDTTAFVTYVKHVLCPTLWPGQIVILDNYSIHTSAEVRDLIAARDCTLLFLPTSNG